MRLTVLRMLSTNSLSAFSSAATVRVERSGPVQAARERAAVQASNPVQSLQQTKPALPGIVPQGPLPRGSLLNLSV